jgi:hypothetical protein
MWRGDGTKLTGSYGTWKGREVELRVGVPEDGMFTVIQDGGERPSAEWERLDLPNRFARGPVRFYLHVPADEVSDVHRIRATATWDYEPLNVVAEDGNGNLAVETLGQWSRDRMGTLVRNYGFEWYDNAFVFGWIPASDASDLTLERRDRKR